MMEKIYEKLRRDLIKETRDLIKETRDLGLNKQRVRVRCKALSAKDAIGEPEHSDYPILKGKEAMVEAVFKGAKGQAFSDEFENRDYALSEIVDMKLDSNSRRASFVSAFNAVFRYLDLCEKTIHCKDDEPLKCAKGILEIIPPDQKILLVGCQPRFAEILAVRHNLRIVDLDKDNINREVSGALVEGPENTEKALDWCDLILATGSTLVNGTIVDFINRDKPAIFYGVTISAAAKVLNLKTWCHCGR